VISGVGVDVKVDALVVAGGPGHGVMITEVARATLRNVTVVGNAGYGLVVNDSLGTLDNVLAYDNQSPDIVVSGGLMPTRPGYELAGTDPKFVTYNRKLDPLKWDLHLRSTSPAFDAGDPALTDVDGSASDLGGYGGPAGDAYNTDTDTDNLPDGWEYEYFNDLSKVATSQGPDADGLNAAGEYAKGTDPNRTDTDGVAPNDASDANPLDPTLP
jgi:hypothetical protein